MEIDCGIQLVNQGIRYYSTSNRQSLGFCTDAVLSSDLLIVGVPFCERNCHGWSGLMEGLPSSGRFANMLFPAEICDHVYAGINHMLQ